MIVAHAFATPEDVWGAWLVHPEALLAVLAAAVWYARGVELLTTYPRMRVASFFTGLAVIAVALASPLDAMAETIFSGHMVQHLLLVVVAAPLVAYGAPVVPMLRVLPRGLRRGFRRLPRSRRVALHPLVALAGHALVIWVWHLPSAYEAAVRNDLVHAVEHICFFGTALWFWATIVPARRRSAAPYPLRILALFGYMLQSGALGVTLLFAAQALYRVHGAGELAWGLTPLGDQQLAGAIMWVSPAPLLFGAMALLFVRWLRQIEMRTRSRGLVSDA